MSLEGANCDKLENTLKEITKKQTMVTNSYTVTENTQCKSILFMQRMLRSLLNIVTLLQYSGNFVSAFRHSLSYMGYTP